ncbi:hypothetical protein [Streptomyces sp. CB01580]|uniref:hypothetical protein n=1 Tax=Streptomyces sp. CB01580 TaxID=1703933 RepID=UPI000938B9C8|nr:hypothetical protein [Streptomyces sp. CB01580]OKJ31462.1 hypothetical protein AMK22_25560 [Streptomyces sp. CB01580]
MQQLPHDHPSPDSASPHRLATVTARERALARVCEGFRTTISPQSAARLADLLSTSAYAQAA